MKELRSEIAANEHEALQLAATHQHLRRQQQGLAERLARLEQQAAARRDAADAGVERQLRDKEAILAENAAAVAKLAENEAAVGGSSSTAGLGGEGGGLVWCGALWRC